MNPRLGAMLRALAKTSELGPELNDEEKELVVELSRMLPPPLTGEPGGDGGGGPEVTR
jgi:hypothetical protein